MFQRFLSNLTRNKPQIPRSSPHQIIQADLERLQTTRNSLQASEPPLAAQRPTEIRIPIFPPNNQGVLSFPIIFSNATIRQAEQSCFLRKTCAIIVSMILWAVLAREETNAIKKIENLGLLAFCCIVYTMFENTVFCLRHLSMTMTIRNEIPERLFDVLDGILVLYFLLALECWDGKKVSKYMLLLTLGLFVMSTSIYVKLALVSLFSNCLKALIRRICETVQVWLIILKLIGSINSGWNVIFLPLGLYLAGHQIYGSYILLKASVKLFKRVNREEINNLDFMKRSSKMSRDVIYYGLLLPTFRMALNLCNQIENNEIEGLIWILFTILQCYSGLFVGYALVFFKLIRELDFDPSTTDSDESMTDDMKPKASSKKYSLVPQKKPGMPDTFLKVSSTYFVKVDDKTTREEDKIGARVDEIEEVSPCYICEEHQPDIILMGCGHGGMCKKCALLSMKKNNCCMQCRKSTQSINQITNEDRTPGVVEACEAFRIVY